MNPGDPIVKNPFARNPFLQKLPPPGNQSVKNPLQLMLELLRGGSNASASTPLKAPATNEPKPTLTSMMMRGSAKPVLPMQNRWKLAEDTSNTFAGGRTALEGRAKGGLAWGHPYEQWGLDVGTGDLIDRLSKTGDLFDRVIGTQHLYSPFRAPFSNEPNWRKAVGPPVIDNYGRGRAPANNAPVDWIIRQIIPEWGERDEEPRPGGPPSGLYDFPVIG